MTLNDQVKAAVEEVSRMWECELSHRCSYTHEERRTAIFNLVTLCREDAQRREEEALIFGALWHVRGGCCNYDWHKKITTAFRSREGQEGERG